MKWTIENNTISALDFSGTNLIKPWGIELADSSSFYSLEDGFGLRYQILDQSLSSGDRTFKAKVKTRMSEGEWELSINDSIVDDKTVVRQSKLHCLKDTALMDFVVRFRFQSQYFNRGAISGREYEHRNTNVYYQFPTDRASLFGNKCSVTISILDCEMPSSFSPHLYIRDQEGEWVVHARMLPNAYDKVVIKLCNPWYDTRPLPQKVSDGILQIPGMKKALLYRCERNPYKGRIMRRINPQAIPIKWVKAGTTLFWKVQMKVNDES